MVEEMGNMELGSCPAFTTSYPCTIGKVSSLIKKDKEQAYVQTFLRWRAQENPSSTCARGIILNPRGKILLKYGYSLSIKNNNMVEETIVSKHL